MTKENLVEDLTKEEEIILEKDLTGEEVIILEKDLIEVEGIILEKDLIEVEEIIMEKDLTEVEEIILEEGLTGEGEIILEEDLTGEEESQPTKKAVDEVTRIRLLINMEIRAIGTVIGNHLLKDSLPNSNFNFKSDARLGEYPYQGGSWRWEALRKVFCATLHQTFLKSHLATYCNLHARESL